MGELKISNLIEKDEIEKLMQLDKELAALKDTYVAVATELAKGLKIEVNTPKDLDKLYELYNKQAASANKVSGEFTVTLEKQKQVLNDIADNLQKQATSGNLSAKEMKALSDAGAKNAVALEKLAKAEEAAVKAQNAGNVTRKSTVKTEEDRQRVIKEAIALSNKEVHSIQEANEANTKMRQAVKLLRDTDEGYTVTLARLNSTIGINSDYVKRNSDRYTKQKMTIGAYREEVKAAIIELQNGNRSMKNFGIVAKGFGGILKSSVVGGFNEVRVGIGTMIKGFVGAQAVIGGIQRLFGLIRSGIGSIVDFEAANSKLAAILGTTANNIKELTADAQRLGATTKYTASQATALQIELAKLGFSTEEIRNSTEYVLRFAQATGSELPEAAALAGAALRMFNADTTETERYVSAMAVATTKSALSFSYLQTAMPIVGPVAKAFNFTIEDTLALLGKLADSGFDASMAATATRNIFLNLADSTGNLAKALGGPVKTLPELVAGLRKLREQGIDLNTTLELTDKRSVAAFNSFLTAADKIIPLREQVTGVGEELEDMAKTMGDNVQGAVLNLQSAWEALMLSFSEGTGPAKDFINWVALRIREIADLLKTPEQKAEGEAAKLQLAAQKEVHTNMEILELDFQKRVEQLRKQYLQKYKSEGMKEEIANAKAMEQAKVDAAKESIVELGLIRSRQKEFNERDLKDLEKLKTVYTQSLRTWEENSKYKWTDNLLFNGQSKQILSKMFGFETEEIKNVNKAFTAFANKQMDASKSEAYNKSLDQTIEKMKEIAGLGNNAPSKTNSDFLTDKQKKELEKQAKERQKIRENMQQSELDLMDEGLEKELAKIAFSYNKKLAAVKGNSEEEQKTRENLAKKMQQDIGNYEVDYYLKKETENIQHKLSIVKKGSDEEYDLKLQLLNLQEEAEKEAAIRGNEDIVSIDEKFAKKRLELDEKYALEKNKNLEEEYAARTILVNTAMAGELDALAEKYKDGLINAEKYEKEKAAISRKYMLQQLKDALELAKVMADMPGLSDEDRLKMKRKVAETEIALSNAVRDAEVSDAEDAGKERKKWLGELGNSLDSMNDLARDALGETAGIFEGLSKMFKDLGDDGKLGFETLANACIDMIGGINSIVQNSFSKRIESIEAEQDANDEAYEKDVERIESLADKGAITEEEAEARKRAAKDMTDIKNAELEKKKQALAQKQARWDKATSIAQAGIATALAITKALPNFILAALVGVMGAVQIATIAATPIPSYAEGTKGSSHPGGKALVGDAGKHEVVMYNGLAWITPDTPLLVDLPRGAKVFPDVDDTGLPDWNQPAWEPSFDNHHFVGTDNDGRKTTVINDFSRLERKMEENNRLLAQSIKQRRQEKNELEFELYKLSKL